jgi:hypothetical protein
VESVWGEARIYEPFWESKQRKIGASFEAKDWREQKIQNIWRINWKPKTKYFGGERDGNERRNIVDKRYEKWREMI